MRISLGTRLTLLIAGTIAIALAVLFQIVNRSTRFTFVEHRVEVHSRSVESEKERIKLATLLETSFCTNGWSGVRKELNRIQSEQLGQYAAVAIDRQFDIQAFSEPEFQSAVISQQTNGFDVRIESETELEVYGFEFSAEEPNSDINSKQISIEDGQKEGRNRANAEQEIIVLTGSDQTQFGYLVFLPIIDVDKESGRFAGRVWQTAGWWMLLTVGLAMIVTTLLVKRSLRPIELLTLATKKLKQGEFPSPIQNAGDADFEELINTFNQATQSIAKTDGIRKQFISDIAHELRTPLTNIKGQLEAAESGLLAKDNKLLDTLRTESQLLERLINDFQELAISDSGQLRMNLQSLPLKEIIVDIFDSGTNTASFQFCVDIPSQLQVVADEDRMRQVIGNLIENSIRYNSVPMKFHVDAQQVSEMVLINFCDDGQGIALEDQPYIFDRFYRAEKSRNRDLGGSGLGLAIVKSILNAMQGKIKFVQSAGQGAKFQIELPSVVRSLS